MAAGTMETIKKKMQMMRHDKESSVTKAQTLEERLNEQKSHNETVGGWMSVLSDVVVSWEMLCEGGCCGFDLVNGKVM